MNVEAAADTEGSRLRPAHASVLKLIGQTPMVELQRFETGKCRLFIKLESRHSVNRLRIAQWLEGRAGVRRLVHPVPPSHPQHRFARRQMHAFGGLMTTHGSVPAEKRAAVGMSAAPVRLSRGIEDTGDLNADLGQAPEA